MPEIPPATVDLQIGPGLKAALIALGWIPPEGRSFEALTGTSRKIGREFSWTGVPGVTARVLAIGRQGDDAYAWIEARKAAGDG